MATRFNELGVGDVVYPRKARHRRYRVLRIDTSNVVTLKNEHDGAILVRPFLHLVKNWRS